MNLIHTLEKQQRYLQQVNTTKLFTIQCKYKKLSFLVNTSLSQKWFYTISSLKMTYVPFLDLWQDICQTPYYFCKSTSVATSIILTEKGNRFLRKFFKKNKIKNWKRLTIKECLQIYFESKHIVTSITGKGEEIIIHADARLYIPRIALNTNFLLGNINGKVS